MQHVPQPRLSRVWSRVLSLEGSQIGGAGGKVPGVRAGVRFHRLHHCWHYPSRLLPRPTGGPHENEEGPRTLDSSAPCRLQILPQSQGSMSVWNHVLLSAAGCIPLRRVQQGDSPINLHPPINSSFLPPYHSTLPINHSHQSTVLNHQHVLTLASFFSVWAILHFHSVPSLLCRLILFLMKLPLHEHMRT